MAWRKQGIYHSFLKLLRPDSEHGNSHLLAQGKELSSSKYIRNLTFSQEIYIVYHFRGSWPFSYCGILYHKIKYFILLKKFSKISISIRLALRKSGTCLKSDELQWICLNNFGNSWWEKAYVTKCLYTASKYCLQQSSIQWTAVRPTRNPAPSFLL